MNLFGYNNSEVFDQSIFKMNIFREQIFDSQKIAAPKLMSVIPTQSWNRVRHLNWTRLDTKARTHTQEVNDLAKFGRENFEWNSIFVDLF